MDPKRFAQALAKVELSASGGTKALCVITVGYKKTPLKKFNGVDIVYKNIIVSH